MTTHPSRCKCSKLSEARGARAVHFWILACCVTAPQAELPDELVRRRAGDAHAAAVDAVEVMGGAEADQIRGVIASALGTGLDVVRVHCRPAAARDLAEVLVAGADTPLQRVRLLQLLSPDLHEVLRQRHQALSSR